jgi:hypothetical protein
MEQKPLQRREEQTSSQSPLDDSALNLLDKDESPALREILEGAKEQLRRPEATWNKDWGRRR